MAYSDLRVQRGVAVFGASADTVSVAVSIGDVDRALLRITTTNYGSAGTDSPEVGTRNCDDLGARIDHGTITGDGFQIQRSSAGANVDFQVHWELIEYLGPAGGPNEFEVVKRGEVRMLTGTASGTVSVSGLSDDYDQVTPHLMGVVCESTGTTYDRGLTTLRLDKSAGAEKLEYHRGTGTDTTWYTYCLVDWKGANYTVENNIAHSCAAAGANEAVAITALPGSTITHSVVFATYRTSGGGLDETGWNVWFKDSSSLYCRLRSGAGTAGNAFEACVVTNPTWEVQHLDSILGGGTGHSSGTNTTNITVTSTDLERSAVVGTTDCNGSGNAYPRQFWGYRLTSATNVEFRRGRNGQAGDWALLVPEFRGYTATGDSTLEELTIVGSGVLRRQGTGSMHLAELQIAGEAEAGRDIAATGMASAALVAAGAAAVQREAGAASVQSITAGAASVGRSGGAASSPDAAGAAGVPRWQ